MNELRRSRESLHSVAEWLLAGPQKSVSDTVRLQIVPEGFATVAEPNIAVHGVYLVHGGEAVAIHGRTIDSLAREVGIAPRSAVDAHSSTPTDVLTRILEVDDEAVSYLMRCYEWGHQAMVTFCAHETPVLWPEHFDVAITWDEVNFGVSPGDDFHPEPYAYVGPWTPRSGEFWNASFGAFRSLSDLASPEGIIEFFTQGRRHAQES